MKSLATYVALRSNIIGLGDPAKLRYVLNMDKMILIFIKSKVI